MRWRNLSPRFRVDPTVTLTPAAEDEQSQVSSETSGVSSTSLRPSETGIEAAKHQGDASAEVAPSMDPAPRRELASSSNALRAQFSGTPSTESTAGTLSEGSTAGPQRTARYAAHEAEVLLTARVQKQTEGTVPQKVSNGDTRASGASRATRGVHVSADPSDSTDGTIPLPEGCSPHLTDMSFFKKLGLLKGRLTANGPLGSNTLADDGSAVHVAEDGTWMPNVIGAEVKCPPVVHPDTCGLTASFNRKHDSPWIWRLERDENLMAKEKDASLEYADVVWIFRGTFVSKVSLRGLCRTQPHI